jgi:hypothetical protein
MKDRMVGRGAKDKYCGSRRSAHMQAVHIKATRKTSTYRVLSGWVVLHSGSYDPEGLHFNKVCGGGRREEIMNGFPHLELCQILKISQPTYQPYYLQAHHLHCQGSQLTIPTGACKLGEMLRNNITRHFQVV